MYGFFLAMKDWKVWWFAMALTAITIGLSFNAYFRKRESDFSFLTQLIHIAFLASKYIHHLPLSV